LIAAAALLLADSRTPTGSYAHSGGLERAIADGMAADRVPDFIYGRLQTVAFTEAALTAAAVNAGKSRLAELDQECAARTPSPALRAAASALGRSILRTGAQLFPSARGLSRYRESSTTTPRPIALGVVAGAAGLDPQTAALVALHDDAAMVASAAVKLVAVDAGAAAAWVAALGAEMARLARLAADAPELPSVAAPLIELRSLAHAHDQRRLFAS
jgi:urease accessory protein